MKLPNPKLAILGFAFIISIAVAAIHQNTVQAVSAADWKAGNIISDSLFYDNNSMSVDDVQNFLNSKNPNCDTWGTQRATEKGRSDITHAQYAQLVGWPGPPYICLKDYYQVPRSDTIINNYNPSAARPAGSISAAQIIKSAADIYGVSPKALIVLLHKESPGPLTVDSWPLQSQYRNAMGYACPDTAPCDPQFAGFYNQVTNAAKRIQMYKQNAGSYRHKPFAWNSQVYYNPNLNGCRWSSVYIEGYATAGLYNYTPYQPNAAALANMYGTGDGCSAYGNRNFWRIYNDWFGNTQGTSWSQLQDPRIFVTNKATSKINPLNGQPVQSISAGLEIRFDTKEDSCLRTRHDTLNNISACINISDLSEFNPVTAGLKSNGTTEYRSIVTTTCKVDYLRDNIASPCLPPGTIIQFQKKVSSLGVTYLMTKNDVDNDSRLGFRLDRLSSPISVTWEPLQDPRIMVTGAGAYTINPYNKERIALIPTGAQLKFSTKSGSCLRTEQNSTDGKEECVDISQLSELRPNPTSLSTTSSTIFKNSIRWTCQVDYARDRLAGKCIDAGTSVTFSKRTTVASVEYLITPTDEGKNTIGFRADRFN